MVGGCGSEQAYLGLGGAQARDIPSSNIVLVVPVVLVRSQRYTHKMNAKATYTGKWIVTVGVLGLLIYFVPVPQIAEVLAGASVFFCIIGFLLQFVVRAVATLRMKVIAANQGIKLNHYTIFSILLTTHFYSMLLPGPLAGGGVHWFKLVQHGASKGAAVATIVLNRGIRLVIMIATGIFAWLIDHGTAGSVYGAITIVIVVAVISWLTFARFSIPKPKDHPVGKPKWKSYPSRFLRRLRLFQQVSNAGKCIVLAASLAHEIVAGGVIWAFALTVGLKLDLLTAIWIHSSLQVVLMLPLSIAGLGLREASLVGMGALIGIAPATAMAWSLVIFSSSIAVAAVGGLIEANSVSRHSAQSINRLMSKIVRGDTER